jgi:uncharacterized protein YydD (DUF2326 family)
MKLIELGADRSSFKTVRFRDHGITLIVGDAAKGNSKEGSSNGVGKTLSLGLVHHLLGAKPNAKLAAAVPDWIFRLTIRLKGKEHLIERSGDGGQIFLDGKQLKLSGLREWLDASGAFRLDEHVPGLSFRALFTRFARYQREDCSDPVRTFKEKPVDSLIYSLYLLGVDTALAVSKKQVRLELDKLQKSAKSWQTDPLIKSILRTGLQPKLRVEKLSREIESLRTSLEEFQVAADYRALENEANILTDEVRHFDQQIAVRQFQLEGISKAIRIEPDISRSDLLNLYQGLEATFKPEALKHFETVEKFHESLAGLRKTRLERDQVALIQQIKELERQRTTAIRARDERLATLKGKKALDEYAAIANELATLEEERNRLREFLALTENLKAKQQILRERVVEEDRSTTEYLATDPVAAPNHYFQKLAEILYPKAPSGILLENKISERSQSRYDLLVQIEGDDSDGINAARILCFDWLLLMHGSNHSMDFLWHDNRIFAHIDPAPRAAWFKMTASVSAAAGKQYLATINTENFNAMQPHLDEAEWERLRDSVCLTLRGDHAENKLLGIQFGGN